LKKPLLVFFTNKHCLCILVYYKVPFACLFCIAFKKPFQMLFAGEEHLPLDLQYSFIHYNNINITIFLFGSFSLLIN